MNKMSKDVRRFWWPRNTEAIQKKCGGGIPGKMSDKNIRVKGWTPRPSLLQPAASSMVREWLCSETVVEPHCISNRAC